MSSKINLKWNEKIIESATIDDEFIIKGIAINETTTSNNHKFIGEELDKASSTLKGVPLLIDHRNEVSAIKGRVTESRFDELQKNIPFTARVMDKNIQSMIKDGRINSVSIGADVEEVEEGENGVLIPKGIKFQELSLVAIPADHNATFTNALQESYSSRDIESKGGNKMAEEETKEETEEPKEETKEPEKAEESKEEPKEDSNEPEETEDEETKVEAKLKKAKLELKKKELATIEKKLKEADVDEEPEEEPEESKEDEDEPEEEEAEESGKPKFVENLALDDSITGRGFTIVR